MPESKQFSFVERLVPAAGITLATALMPTVGHRILSEFNEAAAWLIASVLIWPAWLIESKAQCTPFHNTLTGKLSYGILVFLVLVPTLSVRIAPVSLLIAIYWMVLACAFRYVASQWPEKERCSP